MSNKKKLQPTLTAPDSRRQLKRSKSHALITAGFRRLRTISQSQNRHQSANEEDVPELPKEPIRAGLRASSAAKPSHTPLPSVSLPILCLSQAVTTGALPSQLSQLRGIHIVGDPSEDPDLDEDTTINTLRSRSSVSNSSAALDGPRYPSLDVCEVRQKQGDCNCLSCNPPTPTRSMLTESSATPRSSYLDTLSSSPRSSDDRNILPLSPRACLTAFPPIDLKSPYAPYAPTPPLSPPGTLQVNSFSVSTASKHSNGFNISKGLRKLPSTMIFKTGLKDQNVTQVHQVSSRGSGINSMISQSTVSLKARIGTSQERDTMRGSHSSSKATSPLLNKNRFMGSTASLVSRCSSNPPKITTSKLNGSRTLSPEHKICPDFKFPPSKLSSCEPSEASKPSDKRERSNSSKSQFRGGFNNLMVPISRFRTYSSLNTIFRKGASKPRSETSSFEAGDRSVVSICTDSCYEVLDATVMSARHLKISQNSGLNSRRPSTVEVS
ncbi:expressed protein [Phakopsora pachyrhizi]|uniref:Expressed protein n=1 Tax=Phakopsora pachyrhizi TaxID=170000 RepID=A0AAV0AF83_PHAPC|nr:expressed protein [Phakopsora pachyrhizi]